MSYAEMAAKGPKQTPEEQGDSPLEEPDRYLQRQRLAPMRHGTDNGDSRAPAQVQVEHAPEDSVHSLVDVDSPHISSVPSDYESQSIKTDTQAERLEREEEVRQEAQDMKDKAAAKKEAAKEKAKKNADNPVVLSNAVGLAVVGGIVGFGAYRQYARGELTGKVVAAWAAAIGLFGVGDYYVSQYFFKRNPPQ